LSFQNEPVEKMKRKRLKAILRSAADRVAQVREQIAFNRLHRKPPDLIWKVCGPCPERRTEGTVVKIGHRFFIVGGYQAIDRVLSVIDVFDLEKRRWVDRIAMPANVPQTHIGTACGEERFIYLVAGQVGAQCRPAVADCFVLDVQTKSWGRLPSLPEARYSPTVQLWNGRLHAISGAKPDRWTSACSHWSIAVGAGKALEEYWRKEVSISKGGPHRTSAVLDGKLYVLGGQDGDAKPVPADPCYTCDWSTPLEVLYGDSFRWDADAKQWRTVSPMPAPRTHSDCVIILDRYAVMAGGNEGRKRLSDLIQVYDSRADRWSVAGRLPYAMKTSTVYHEGWLYTIAGQRSVSRNDLRPGEVIDTVWRAMFDPTRCGV
jgi:hypothetical protein